MAETSVVVGVRVRPFNDRELKLKAELCVAMEGPMTTLTKLPEGTETHFTFDESFWSHDGFTYDESGFATGLPGRNYADQHYVYDKFGKRVLDSAWEGFHSCLFAYGQTGAGKSYSTYGFGVNKGIVPISCEEIFKRIDASGVPGKRFELSVSMIELYNEAIQDLLVLPEERPKRGLEIRESKMLGIYIDGVSKRPIVDYTSIEKCIDEGTEHRTIGSTNMNASSSRAHTVMTIEFKQVELVAGKEQTKVSMINMVDLAGSEKACQTGAEGARLKEGCAINSSLTALGNVIEKLAEKCQSKKKKDILIPYRNSKLTRLLQNALGGSSKTIMISALSPASTNHEETLSTLRYADRAKKIKNTAVVNENPQDSLLRQLKEENDKLKQLFEAGGAGLGLGVREVAEMAERQREIESMEKALNDMQRSFQEKLQEAQENDRRRDMRKRSCLTFCSMGTATPHLINLNDDMALSGRVKYQLPEDALIYIGYGGENDESSDSGSDSDSGSSDGKAGLDTAPDIILIGSGIFAEHATLHNRNGQVYLNSKGKAAAFTYVNGVCFDRLKREGGQAEGDPDKREGIKLEHADRVTFGRSFFAFIDPTKGVGEVMLASGVVTYAEARKEIRQNEYANNLFAESASGGVTEDDSAPSGADSDGLSKDRRAGRKKSDNALRAEVDRLTKKLKLKDTEIESLKRQLGDKGGAVGDASRHGPAKACASGLPASVAKLVSRHETVLKKFDALSMCAFGPATAKPLCA